jgi:hypothetical protein
MGRCFSTLGFCSVPGPLVTRSHHRLCLNCQRRQTRAGKCPTQGLCGSIPEADRRAPGQYSSEFLDQTHNKAVSLSPEVSDTPSDNGPLTMFDSVSSCTVWTVDPFSSHLCFSVIVSRTNRSARTLAMLDSGATAVFINERFVSKHNILCCPLTRPIALHNIDGSINKTGSLTHFAHLTMNIGSKYTGKLDFLITDLGPEVIILGLPWLRRINPEVNWDIGTIELLNSPEPDPLPDDSPFEKISANRATRRTWIKAGIISETTDELWCCAGFTLSTELAAKANEAKAKKTFEQMVLKEYHKYSKVFSEVDLHHLPQHCPWDHAIDLKPDALETLKSKVYPILHSEQGVLDKFIEEQLAKGYIVPSKSPMASPVFFVKKKNG